MAKKPNEGFSFKCRGAQYRIEWDSAQYILISGSTKYYYPTIFALLTELISIVPKTSIAGNMHEFQQDIEDSMVQIRQLCRYIEKNFKPQKPEEATTKWAIKYTEKNEPLAERVKKAKKKEKEHK